LDGTLNCTQSQPQPQRIMSLQIGLDEVGIGQLTRSRAVARIVDRSTFGGHVTHVTSSVT